jgi:hypothetical protein
MTSLTDMLTELATTAPTIPTSVAWLAERLPRARIKNLSAADLARIDSYYGGGGDLHDLLPAIAWPAEIVWYEADVVAQGGTAMTLGYMGAPAPDAALDLAWTAWSPANGQLIRPLGPVRITAGGMDRPAGTSDSAWREMRAAAGILIRALMLGM